MSPSWRPLPATSDSASPRSPESSRTHIRRTTGIAPTRSGPAPSAPAQARSRSRLDQGMCIWGRRTDVGGRRLVFGITGGSRLFGRLLFITAVQAVGALEDALHGELESGEQITAIDESVYVDLVDLRGG